MKILHLPLKAKWYEMIESGVKTEEYREIEKRECIFPHQRRTTKEFMI